MFILIIFASSSSLSPTPSVQLGTQQTHYPAPHFYRCPVCSGLVPCQCIWLCSILFSGYIVLTLELQSHAFMWFILHLLSSGVCDDTGQVSAQCHFSITPHFLVDLWVQEIMNLLRAGTPISTAVSPTTAMFCKLQVQRQSMAQGWHPTSVSSAELSNKYSARSNILSIREKLVSYGQTAYLKGCSEVCANTPLFGGLLTWGVCLLEFSLKVVEKSLWAATSRAKSQL